MNMVVADIRDLPARRSSAVRSIGALLLREMSTTYGRSPGGWLWAVIEPVAVIALLSLAFSLAFRAPPLGHSFPLFYASGYIFYMIFHDLSQKLATSIRFSRPLLSFGAVTVYDVLAARLILNTLTHVCIGSLVLVGIIVVEGGHPWPDPARLGLAAVMAVGLAVGVGIVNAYLFLAFPAWERLWTIAMRPMFLVSGVVFLLEDVPADYRPILQANPLFHVTGMAREAFYPAFVSEYVSAWYVLAIGLGLAVIGMLLLRRFQDEVRMA